MIEIFDTIIIGSGPAGSSAAIYLGMNSKKVLMIGGDKGGQLSYTNIVENYLGLPGLTGYEMTNKFLDHVAKYIEENNIIYEFVTKILQEDDIFYIYTADNVYKSKTIIIATGSAHKKIEFSSPFIQYCAICDGFLYKGKDVAVVGGGNSAFESINYLSDICNKVISLHRSENYRAFDNSINSAKLKSNVEFYKNISIKSLDTVVTNGIERLQIVTSDDRTIIVDALFVNIGMIPNTSFLYGNEKNQITFENIKCNENGNIIVDKTYSTSYPGIYACGDVCTSPIERDNQAGIAAGEGTSAALSIIRYLSRK